MNEHTRFRQSKRWKEFRIRILIERDVRCEACGQRYTGKNKRQLQVHHRKPNAYEHLNSDDFAVLCSMCHKEVEKLAKRLAGKKAGDILNKDQWMNLLGRFLSNA